MWKNVENVLETRFLYTTDVIQDNPFGKRILRNKKKTTNESFHVELGENSNDYSTDKTENPCETTDVYVQSSQSSGSRVTEVKGLDVQEMAV